MANSAVTRASGKDHTKGMNRKPAAATEELKETTQTQLDGLENFHQFSIFAPGWQVEICCTNHSLNLTASE